MNSQWSPMDKNTTIAYFDQQRELNRMNMRAKSKIISKRMWPKQHNSYYKKNSVCSSDLKDSEIFCRDLHVQPDAIKSTF